MVLEEKSLGTNRIEEKLLNEIKLSNNLQHLKHKVKSQNHGVIVLLHPRYFFIILCCTYLSLAQS